MKKLFIISLLLFLPILVMAQEQKPLVPCTIMNCTLCKFFEMLDNVFDFIVFKIAPPLAALMIAIGGLMYIVGGSGQAGGPDLINQAKKLFVAVIIGLIIVYGAWALIALLMQILGYGGDGWSTINC